MFGWTRKQQDDVGRLIAKGKYREARGLLQQELRQDPDSVSARLRLADVLALERKTLEALRVLGRLSEELVEDGFEDKAAAVLKKMQRLNPALPSLGERWATLTAPLRLDLEAPVGLAA